MKHVVDKFHGKLPKDELKKFAREVNKKLVSSDYKNNRVEDPTSISSKQAKKVHKYAHDFFQRAVVKFTDHEKKKKEVGSADKPAAGTPSQPGEATSSIDTPIEGDISPTSSPGRKRKRDADDDQANSPEAPPSETPSVKRVKDDEADAERGHPSPPTPPPPPAETPPTEEERSMREQEEALMRENEEAQRLEDEAQAHQGDRKDGGGPAAVGRVNGSGDAGGGGSEMDIDDTPQEQQQQQPQKQAVLSH